ncbi:NUDIX domain-containing protein [Streptomyces sp. NPDC019224]|uniref:NUDIX domain-containing protein n=1 Tax=Streptomyces sp. NPDC019224 TaxID=3154484 RepID=UPI00340F4C54
MSQPPQPPAPIRSHVRTGGTPYLDRHPEERAALAPLLSALDAADDPTARTAPAGHVTCSAAVVDRAGRVLHVRHRVTGLLLAPGGHVEPGEPTLLAAAPREVEVHEPGRCLSWDRWPLDALPGPVVPPTRAAIEGIRAGRLFTGMGWEAA